jgi:hypothetical protein
VTNLRARPRSRPCGRSDRLWVPPCPHVAPKWLPSEPVLHLVFPISPKISICFRFDKNKKLIYEQKILNTKLAQENFHTKSVQIQKSSCKNFSKKIEGNVLTNIRWKSFERNFM